MTEVSKECGIITESMIEKNWAQPLVPESFPSYKMIAQAKALESEGILPSGVMERLAERVKGRIANANSSLQVITSAASLAHQGLLGPVEQIWLRDVNLTSVPPEHIASLISSVTRWVRVRKVSGGDLVTILDSVKSQQLVIYEQSLGRQETKALVRAMESRVEWVMLGEVTLDIKTLTKYKGQGKCLMVDCFADAAAQYIKQLKTWAKRIRWRVIPSVSGHFQMKRL